MRILTDTEVHGVLLNALTMARQTWEADAHEAESRGDARLAQHFNDARKNAAALADAIESAERIVLEG